MSQSSCWLLATFLSLIASINADGQCESCTLTVLCWVGGGVRLEGGCSGPSWLTTCCVPQLTRNDDSSNAPLAAQQQVSVGGLRSASGSGRPTGLVSTLEGIANLGRNDWMSNWSSDQRYYTTKPLSHQPLPPLTQVRTQQQLHYAKKYQQQQRQHPLVHFNGNSLAPQVQSVCGVQPLKSKLQKRIIGGGSASFGEFPWQAHIRIAGFQCGGVLLNHQYIATAAHCVHRAKLSQIIIYLGEYDTKDTDRAEFLPKETLRVVQRKIHPLFKYMLTQPDRYDVALLKLNRPVVYRDNILPICLPHQGRDYESTLGVVAGWGKTDTSFGKTGTNLLQKVYVPIIDNRRCYSWHEHKDIILELHEEMFCAGHEQGKMDACLGDSGGPLVVNDGGRWTLVGITSAGFGCAVDHQPGIYHKVTKTVSWIAANIND